MSYTSKRNAVNIIVGILLMTAYSIYALGESAPVPDNLKSWAVVMLVFIGISIAVMIIIQVLFHIWLAIGIAVREKEHTGKQVERIMKASMTEDERYKLISLKASIVGYGFAGGGFIIALVALAFGLSAVCVLHIMFGTFFTGSIIEWCVSIYHNERGVRNG